jgi:hypothetical protein
MKRTTSAALAAVFLLLTLSGCARLSGKYRLVDVPEDITIEAASLSDELQTDHDIYFSVDFPLVASLPEDGVYVYDVNQKGKYGLFIRYEKTLQYFDWTYIKATSVPEIFMSDYNGDGKKELAVSLLRSVGETNHNEDLHILEYDGGKFTNIIYSAEAFESDAKSQVTITPDEKNDKLYKLTTAMSTKTLDVSGRGEIKSTYFGAVQDFTLGDTIYGEAAMFLAFDDDPKPVDIGVRIKCEVLYRGDSCASVNPVVVTGEE